MRQATLAGVEVPSRAREAGWQPTAGQLNELLPQLKRALYERLVRGAG